MLVYVLPIIFGQQKQDQNTPLSPWSCEEAKTKVVFFLLPPACLVYSNLDSVW